MGWFENQIEERRQADQQLLESAYDSVISSILGESKTEKILDKRIVIRTGIDEILKFYHFKPVDVPDDITDTDSELDYVLRTHGLMKRDIKLPEGWYKDAFGPMLAFTKKEQIPVAVIPGKITGYSFKNPYTNKREKINKKNAALLDQDAICFYMPLPSKKLEIIDLLLFMKRSLLFNDVLFMMLCTLLVTLVSMLLPRITKVLTGPILSGSKPSAVVNIAIAMVCVTISYQIFESIRILLRSRIEIKISLNVQSAMMMRLMSLPPSFFRKYNPGELCSRSMAVNQLCDTLVGIIMDTSLTALVSLLYVFQIFNFAPSLTIPSILIVLITVVFSISSSLVQMGINRDFLNKQAKASGLSYQFISGIKKLKLSGSEKRAYSKWLLAYADQAKVQFNPPLFIKVNGVISSGINLFATIIIYFISARSGLEQSNYFAFMASYGMLMGAFNALTLVANSFAEIKPALEMAGPFLDTAPEMKEGRLVVNNISGGLRVENVSFRYNEDSPYIFRNLSLDIKPGDYIAIVGKTGCGKSTLLRLLLGFEHPEKGAIYYDNQNIDNVELSSLRKKIGTVMQDSSLFQGDIYSNIAITNPNLTLDEAWEAAEIAEIADDIREMPMRMNTMVSEGQGGVSGGQRQRIMIARAVASKPKILMFDEATSALDNKTQKQISDALDKMGCTRIVIAHRLSTIKNCNKILVIDRGEIIESGTYDELINKNQYFAELVKRQQLHIS